jgi:hypothetical protein
MVDRVEGLDRRDALLGIVLSAAVAPLLAPAGALADEATTTTGTAAPTLSPCDIYRVLGVFLPAVYICLLLQFGPMVRIAGGLHYVRG